MSKVSVVSLGCPKNLVDTENLLTGLGEEGFLYTPDAEDADLLLVNTCGFIEDAKKESIEEILKLRHMKREGKKLLVFGCLAKRYGKELLREIPEIDALWGVGEEDKIIEYCKKLRESSKQHEVSKQYAVSSMQKEDNIKQRPGADSLVHSSYSLLPTQSSYAYLKIAEGCSRGCSYCVIPSIRGPFRSVEPDTILKKAEDKVRSGIRELILVAQDIASYGREYHGYNLSSLLRDISSISGEFRIRLLYLYPTAIDDALLSVISDEDKICKYLDIPLQHSEDNMLRAMGRGGTKKGYIRTIKKIREATPHITLRTTFIVGFPGETEDDFIGLRKFVEEMRFERLGVFIYSKEEGTPASRMKGNVPRRVREKRRDEIMSLQSWISLEKNKALIGKSFRALVDEVDGSVAVGRLCSQAPEIDGVVFIENTHGAKGIAHGARKENISKNISPFTLHVSRSLRAGEFVNVLIKEAYDYDLRGELIE